MRSNNAKRRKAFYFALSRALSLNDHVLRQSSRVTFNNSNMSFYATRNEKNFPVVCVCVLVSPRAQGLEVLLRHPEDNRNQIRELAQTLMDGGVLDEIIQHKLDLFNARWDELMSRVRHNHLYIHRCPGLPLMLLECSASSIIHCRIRQQIFVLCFSRIRGVSVPKKKKWRVGPECL